MNHDTPRETMLIAGHPALYDDQVGMQKSWIGFDGPGLHYARGEVLQRDGSQLGFASPALRADKEVPPRPELEVFFCDALLYSLAGDVQVVGTTCSRLLACAQDLFGRLLWAYVDRTYPSCTLRRQQAFFYLSAS